ncbi:hypothetical protein K439DRAFT_1625097 [Ramaria rubella]|nr:hypothetical protein K439DRAFT_1625097 [Ramaria rubella]
MDTVDTENARTPPILFDNEADVTMSIIATAPPPPTACICSECPHEVQSRPTDIKSHDAKDTSMILATVTQTLHQGKDTATSVKGMPLHTCRDEPKPQGTPTHPQLNASET